MPLLSVVTAARVRDDRDLDHLAEAAESLTGQLDLGAWDWEWLVQHDPAPEPLLPAGAVRERLPRDARVRYEVNPLPLGAAGTRTLALRRARGAWMRVLDADDLLLPRGLAAPLELLAAHPRAVWAAGERHELLMPEKRVDTTPLATGLTPGLVEPGRLAELLKTTGRIQVHCAGLTARTDLWRAVGGWAALPRSEDVLGLFTLAAALPGAYSAEPTFLYRRWPGQTTAQPWWPSMKTIARQVLAQRLTALEAPPRVDDPAAVPAGGVR